ncbi:MAG: UbiA family prenyltransferase [Vicinamibacterales bacterium]
MSPTMSTTATTPTDVPPAAQARVRKAWSDYLELTKPRLNLLVVVTTWAGYYLGMRADAPAMLMVHTVVGTTLVAGGASVLNQVWEKDTDRLMRRTRRRPLPDARLQAGPALWFGVLLTIGPRGGMEHRRICSRRSSPWPRC